MEAANSNLAPTHISAVGLRLISIMLSKTPEELMSMALADGDDKDGPTMCALKLFDEVEGIFEGRLEMLRAARTRVLWAARYACGV